MTIQKIKSGRVSAEANSYIGSRGVIFYDETYGDLRLSDGATPGGIPLLSSSSGASVLIANTPPDSGTDGQLFWSPIDQTMLIRFGGTWNYSNTTIPATQSVLGSIKLGTGLLGSSDGTTSVKIDELLTLQTTSKMPIVGNRCVLPSVPLGHFVYNVAIVYCNDGSVEEHDNLSLVMDNGIPYLVFNDSTFGVGYHAVVSYATALV
jgi:hypothetical protein